MRTHVNGKEIIGTQPAKLESGLHEGKELSTILEALLEDDTTVWLCAHPTAPECEYFSEKGSQSVMAHQSKHVAKKEPVSVGTSAGKTVTVEEAAERLQVSTSFVYKRLSDGSLKGERRGNAWRVPLRAIAEYRKQNGSQQATPPKVPEQRQAKPKATKARTFTEVGRTFDGLSIIRDDTDGSMWKLVAL